jgi:hypothetical protein
VNGISWTLRSISLLVDLVSGSVTGWQSVGEGAVHQLLDELAVIGADRARRLAHVDGSEVLLWVDPEIGSGIAGLHELARRARHAGDPADGPHRKAEPERVAWGAEQELAGTKRRGNSVAEMIGGHQRDGRA